MQVLRSQPRLVRRVLSYLSLERENLETRLFESWTLIDSNINSTNYLTLFSTVWTKEAMAENDAMTADTGARSLVPDEEDDQITPDERKKEKRKITKNVFVISFGFLFLFTSFQSLQNLQSSLNKDEGLGLASLCVIYAALILSCIFVPPFVIGRLGCKWTLVLSMTGYVLYTVSNYYARWGTLIPASIIIGGFTRIVNGCFVLFLFRCVLWVK